VHGDLGDFVYVHQPGAVHRALERALGLDAPSRATVYRWDAASWTARFPVDPGSASAVLADPRWLPWDGEPVIAVASLVVEAQSFAAFVKAAGYASRSQGVATDASASAPQQPASVALVGAVIPTI
jgi:hypothetical protein